MKNIFKKTNRYEITIGLNDRVTKTQILTDNEAREIITREILKAGVYAFTLIPCSGIYTHDNGDMVSENSFRIEIIDTDNSYSQKMIIAIIKKLDLLLNQESIMYRFNNKPVQFIGA